MIRQLSHVVQLSRNRPLLAAMVLAGCIAAVPLGHAQKKVQERITPTVEKQASEAELTALRQRLIEATDRQRRLAAEIDAFDQDLGSINRALIVTANRAKELEKQIDIEESRLLELAKTQSEIRRSLNTKRGLLSEVLAALQRMGRNPPPAILVRPEDALASVRSAILLGAVVPEVRTETDTLLSELRGLAKVRQQIQAKNEQLTGKLNSLAEDETRLTLLLEEKGKVASQSRDQLLAERKKSAGLARKAKSLEELIKQIETQIASAAKAAKAARQADERRQQAEQKRLAKAREDIAKGKVPKPKDPALLTARLDEAFRDTARNEPAIAFGKAKGLLPKPVNGRIVHTFGSPSKTKLTHPNLAFATRPNSRVQAPADGWVVYAGPFRSYGQLLILNAGDGYHVVLSGMSDVNASAGQFILAGEPIGRMGVVRVAAASSLDLSSGQPVLYVEFRKDGKSIDPSPWWSAEINKRRENDS